ncbi:MAG: hypothetical protein RMM30_01755 [Armatimonadota bacterium]|nr:hypothetical protein [Armatimonadota bacterium]MDW8155298.1 hypothetical protein [Armatimonadota bacterium]
MPATDHRTEQALERLRRRLWGMRRRTAEGLEAALFLACGMVA